MPFDIFWQLTPLLNSCIPFDENVRYATKWENVLFDSALTVLSGDWVYIFFHRISTITQVLSKGVNKVHSLVN